MNETDKPQNFIEKIISDDLSNKTINQVKTRFPPEPNGYLHIGHAKSICINFGLAEDFGGTCNLRFDDTNPVKEDIEYVESIKRDILWLGFKWDGDIHFTSQYFDQLHDWAVSLIKQGKAYVCELSPEQTRELRGSLKEPGKNSPYRDRSIDENLSLFAQMKAGDFAEGHCTLRAKIDMSAANVQLRDPVIYRIKHASHHQTGDQWCIYPSYDFAHGQSDAIEKITHSVCTLEFVEHRPLYNWFLENLDVPAIPHQYEFSRLNVNYTITSKRKLKLLIDGNHVEGWDDPRMPTISGLRRRGFTPKSIRTFAKMTGVTKVDGVVDVSMLEYAIREDLNENAHRAMCVLRPLKVTLTNYPADKTEQLSAPGHPHREDMGIRTLPFDNELFIDEADFRESANKKYKRLVIGKRVRLRNAYIIEADEAIKNDNGDIIEVRARIIEDTVGKNPADGIKAKGVIHWVSAKMNTDCSVHLYDRLFTDAAPDAGDKDFLDYVNPNSLEIIQGCKAEVGIANATEEDYFQFEREGYFKKDNKHTSSGTLVFNRTIGLRDTWDKK
ncbi:MAG TPA: glutamine--tRNA ligase/YqeY domain fusion protein [Thiotrichaceae bacterium]|nr:glutamine--tRNA ligase/YqeY domain fusion protein [Thiotrichaceae bacterium]